MRIKLLPVRIYYALFLFFFLPYITSSAQKKIIKNSFQKEWNLNPFEQKVFIENKGQYDNTAHNSLLLEKNNLFSTKKVLYVTNSGGTDIYFYSNGFTYKHDAINKEQGNVEYLSLEWLGANLNAEVVSFEPTSFYYTYGGFDQENGSQLKAKGYKKIVYKNLYPFIDVEYVFPEDKSGLKYNLILHPGANPADIKMKYDNAKNVSLTSEGNIKINSDLGEFVDHAPITYIASSKEEIPSKFYIQNNTVGFDINQTTISEDIVIDPWITNPNFIGFNSAYDVNADLRGNVYVYGSYSPYKLARLDTLGVVQWIFNAAIGQTISNRISYGDFAIDPDGFAYIGEGYNPAGARLIKVDTFGLQIGSFPGDVRLQSIWRMELDFLCMDFIVLAGGGSQAYQAGVIDLNLATLVPKNVLATAEGNHDMALLAVDNVTATCYMGTSKSAVFSTFDNTHLSTNYPAMVPNSSFINPSNNGNNLVQNSNVNYINNFTPQTGLVPGNGMNGMAVSQTSVYTYNSDTLKKYNKVTGMLDTAIAVGTTPATYYNGAIQVKWGGLDVDDCEVVYVGYGNNIISFSNNFTIRDTIIMPDTIYDLKIIPVADILDVCGKGFVARLNKTPTSSFIKKDADSCKCNGWAAFLGACFPYTSVLWSTGQTTDSIFNLCPGTYWCLVKTPSCIFDLLIPFEIKQLDFPEFITINDTICHGGSYALPWGPVVTKPGTYIDTSLTAKGCPKITTVNLFVLPIIQDTITVTICKGNTYTLPWPPYTIVSGAGVYISDTLTTSKGCDSLLIVILIVLPPPVTTVSDTICQGNTYTLPWPPYIVVGTGGSYTDTLTTTKGCDSIFEIVLTILPPPITPVNVSICQGDLYNPPWGGSPIGAGGTYYDTLTTSKGCDSIIMLNLTIQPYVIDNISVTICDGNSYQLPDGTITSVGGTFYDTVTAKVGCDTLRIITVIVTAPPVFSYKIEICDGETIDLPHGVIANVSGVYYDTVSTTKGCDSVIVTELTVHSAENSFFIPNAFTPNDDGKNDLFTLTNGWKDCFEIIQLEIYNRWGLKIYETTKNDLSWDGKINTNGKKATDGTYFYIVKYVTRNGINGKQSGFVNLLR